MCPGITGRVPAPSGACPPVCFPATGRPFELSVVSIGRMRAGKIVEHKDYWDLTDYLRQVGLMPSAASAG
jgi:hypothetical protein